MIYYNCISFPQRPANKPPEEMRKENTFQPKTKVNEPDRKPGDRIKPPRWYNGEKFEYVEQLKTKGKVTMYFKTESHRYSANRVIYRYYKIYESGLLVFVDLTMMKTGVLQSLSLPPFQMKGSNKREFDKAIKEYKQLLEL